jgi:hypothetical protein
MVKATFAFLAASAAFLLSSTVEAVPVSLATSGQTAALISASEYCIFLPPKAGGNISDNEDKAIAFCNKPISTAPKAKTLPAGFIKSIHFVHNTSKNYVQITVRAHWLLTALNFFDTVASRPLSPSFGSFCSHFFFVFYPWFRAGSIDPSTTFPLMMEVDNMICVPPSDPLVQVIPTLFN